MMIEIDIPGICAVTHCTLVETEAQHTVEQARSQLRQINKRMLDPLTPDYEKQRLQERKNILHHKLANARTTLKDIRNTPFF